MNKEWDHAATVELRAHPHPPTCLFKDIAGFLKSHLRCVLSDLQSTDRLTTDLEPLIETDKAVKTYLGHESSTRDVFLSALYVCVWVYLLWMMSLIDKLEILL